MAETLLRNASILQDRAEALAEAKTRYAAANPASARRQDEAAASLPGGNTRTVLHYPPFPLAFTSAQDATLHAADGQALTDFLGEYTAGLYGHSHPAILGALQKALANGLNFGGHNLMESQLAALLCGRFPSLDLVRFTNSGTEANLMAAATACAITGRRKILVFQGGYHGAVFTFAKGGAPLNAPYDFVVARYNDLETTGALLAEHRGTLAAIMIEPMLGGGGCIPATTDFLQMLRAEATASGTVLVFDEVMTSRLSPGGLQKVRGVTPDITTLGKYLGGGMSFGAFGGKREIMERFDPSRPDAFAHAGTFNNNVLTMAAGIAGLRDVYTDEAAAALNARGEALRARLNAIFTRDGVELQATGYGSMMAFHATSAPIGKPEDLAGTDPQVIELLFFDLIEAGFWIARRGMIALSLAITDADCDRLCAAVERFVTRRKALLMPG